MIIELPENTKSHHNAWGNPEPLPEVAPVSTISSATFLRTVLQRELNLHHLSRDAIVLPGESPQIGATSLLFAAANQCYDLHEPFSLAPEVVWFTILSAIARVVKAEPERFGHLYSHEPTEHQTLRVFIDDFRYGQQNDWTRGIAQFKPLLLNHVPDGLLEHALPTLSTLTPESEVALLLVFMDSASPYYQYRMTTRCGIPRIRLEGTAADWGAIQHHAAALAEVFAHPLRPYFSALLPVLSEIAATAAGAPPDLSFWDAIYKRHDGSGGPYVSGWLTTLLAHRVDRTGQAKLRHPDTLDWEHDGLTTNQIVSHVSTLPFIWEYFLREIPMAHVAGIIGVERDAEGFTCPRLGFAVVERHE